MNLKTVDTGLDGVPVCTSDISLTTMDPEGNPILLYRGYSIYDLVKGLFEESVYLLLYGELPNRNQLEAFSKKLKDHARLDERVIQHIRGYPKEVHMMDFLLTTLSYARMFDEDYHNDLWQKPRMDHKLAELVVGSGVRLGAKIPAIVAHGHRILNGRSIIPPDPALTYAANFLNMLGIKPEDDAVEALNVVLILYLEHTLNCSTFASLVAESSMTDPYGPLLAAGVSLKGVRHGGANELAADMFDEIGRPENAEAYIYQKLNAKELVFGFGHRLQHYKHKVESRVTIAERIGRPLAEKKGMGHYFEIYDIISRVMLKEKDRTPNADLPICLLLKAIGIPKKLNTPLFQASRHFGWVANNLRQRKAKGPLYRPRQEYTGPGIDELKTYVPLEKR
ncbi:MAG: citrate/2-methylcitrate synthase [Nitrospinales bacterium]